MAEASAAIPQDLALFLAAIKSGWLSFDLDH